MTYIPPTFEKHTDEVRELLGRADLSKNSMLTSEQIRNCYELLESDEWEVMAPNSLRDNIMGNRNVPRTAEVVEEWIAKSLDRGTGMVCPHCDQKMIVNFDALDEVETVACIYCGIVSNLPEDVT